MIKAICFDVGHTLIKYNNPLNWSSLYRPALEHAVQDCGIELTSDMFDIAAEILSKYNTRKNYREVEVTATAIFDEIFNAWDYPKTELQSVKSGFFSYFQSGAEPFPEAADTLTKLKQAGIKIGALTDVAYGMENEFSLKDIEPLASLIDITFTSVDVGYRKPNKAGFVRLLDFFGISPDEMMYVGDEEKDIVGANALGIVSVLINRDSSEKAFGQCYTIESLDEIFLIV